MSESKETPSSPRSSSDAEERRLRALPVVDVTSVEISPNPAALTDELNLEVDFTLDKPVADGVWDIEYLVDSVTKRHIINILLQHVYCVLGQVEATDYARGANHFQFTATEINIAGIEPSQLTNCGLLTASFRGRDGTILDLNMVIQVTEQRGALQRIIYSPLE